MSEIRRRDRVGRCCGLGQPAVRKRINWRAAERLPGPRSGQKSETGGTPVLRYLNRLMKEIRRRDRVGRCCGLGQLAVRNLVGFRFDFGLCPGNRDGF